MNALKITALGLLLAGTAAEAQKSTPGQTTGSQPAGAQIAAPGADAAGTPAAAEPSTQAGMMAAAPAAPEPSAVTTASAGGAILASDPQGVVSAMQALGYTASLGTDSAGDPLITSEMDGLTFNIYFFGCQENANCRWLLFSAGYDMPNGSTPEVMNDWNMNNLVGQAYLDGEQDPFLNYFVTTTGSLTQENFADVVDWWKIAMGDFQTAIGFH